MKQILLAWLVMVTATMIVKAQSTPSFFWDFETEVPNICSGDACNPHYSAGAHRSTESAKDGSWSLKNEGAWSQGGVHNSSNNHVWAPMTEATVELDWQYLGPYSQRMIFQFSGDWTYSEFDHNDGFGLRTRSENEFALGMGYSTESGSYLKSPYFRVNYPMVEGEWYHIIAKFKQGVGLELTINEKTWFMEAALDSIITENRAWHNICFGNDLKYGCTQYIDNFTVYDHWIDGGNTTDFPMAITTTTLPAARESTAYTATLAASRGTDPYTWEATGLPAGLSVDGSTITGTPVDTGTFTVTVTATDADDSTDSRELELKVRPLHLDLPGGTGRMEAEDMTLENYTLQDLADASEGKIIKASGTGTAQYQFSDDPGVYDIYVAYYDESDGKSVYRVYVNDIQVDSWTADDDLGSKSPEAATLVARLIQGVALATGDEIKVTGEEANGEFGRLDYVETVAQTTAIMVPPVRNVTEHILSSVLYDQYGRRISSNCPAPGIYFTRDAVTGKPVKSIIY